MNNQNKHALLIGINKYSYLPPQYKLNGCINDIEMMASLLEENFGFPESNISMPLTAWQITTLQSSITAATAQK